MAPAPLRILCGVDGSDDGMRGAELAGSLAVALGAELVLAHVIASPGRRVVRVGAHAVADEKHDDSRVARLLAETAERIGIEAVRTRWVEARRETEGLLRAAEVERPALIVLGARGRSALGTVLLGSVSAELPLRASCPVVVLPRDAPVPVFDAATGLQHTIVCGVVDSEDGQAAARVAGDLARALDARLRLVYSRMPTPPLSSGLHGRHGLAVSDEILLERERRIAMALLQRAARWTGYPPDQVEPALEMGEAAERIEAVARRESAVMTVVGSRGLGPLRAAVLGSTSRTLAALAGRPVAIAGRAAFMAAPDDPGSL